MRDGMGDDDNTMWDTIFFGSVSAGAAESNPITTSDLPRIRI
jgi:hypothetical protein